MGAPGSRAPELETPGPKAHLQCVSCFRGSQFPQTRGAVSPRPDKLLAGQGRWGTQLLGTADFSRLGQGWCCRQMGLVSGKPGFGAQSSPRPAPVRWEGATRTLHRFPFCVCANASQPGAGAGDRPPMRRWQVCVVPLLFWGCPFLLFAGPVLV